MTVVKNVLNRIHVQRLLFAAALFGLSLTAHAKGFPNLTGTAAGKSTVIKSGSDGTPLVTSAPSAVTPGGGWTNAGNYGVAQGAGGAVKVGAEATANVAGKGVPVSVVGQVGKDALAGAVEGAIVGARGGLAGAVAGAAIGAALPLALNWAAQAGVTLNTQTGNMEVPDVDSSWPQSDGYRYVIGVIVRDTQQEVCVAYVPTTENEIFRAQMTGVTTTGGRFGYGTCDFDQYRKSDGTRDGGQAVPFQRYDASNCPAGWYKTPAGCVSAANLPRIVIQGQPLIDRLKSSPGVPDPKIVTELDRAGAPLPITDITATGPAAIAGPTTTITNNIDNSVKTSTTTNNYTYNGSKITNTGSTTKTETTKADGTKTEDTTTTMNPGDEQPAKPEETPVQCDKYPNSLGCAELDTPDAEIPKDTKTVNFAAEDPFGGGRCPADVMASFRAIGAQSVKIVDWSTFCDMALPLRGLVMALASIMAFFIIMPGGVRE